MDQITEHKFTVDGEGKLTLVMDALPGAPKETPVMLVSRDFGSAFLHRSAKDMHWISWIDPDVMYVLRDAEELTIVEMFGGEAKYTYQTISTSLME